MPVAVLPPASYASLEPLLAAYAQEMRGHLAGSVVADAGAAAALLDAPMVTVLLAQEAGQACGFAILFELPEVVFARRCGQLDDLFVLPTHRGRGIARALVAAAVQHGRTRQWSHLRWMVPAGDTGAIALYDRIASATDWRSYVIRLDAAASL